MGILMEKNVASRGNKKPAPDAGCKWVGQTVEIPWKCHVILAGDEPESWYPKSIYDVQSGPLPVMNGGYTPSKWPYK